MNPILQLALDHVHHIMILVVAVVGAIAKKRAEANKKLEDDKVRSAPLPSMDSQNPLESQTKKGDSPWGNDTKGPFDSSAR